MYQIIVFIKVFQILLKYIEHIKIVWFITMKITSNKFWEFSNKVQQMEMNKCSTKNMSQQLVVLLAFTWQRKIGNWVKIMSNKFYKLSNNVQQSTNKCFGLIGSIYINVALPSSQRSYTRIQDIYICNKHYFYTKNRKKITPLNYLLLHFNTLLNCYNFVSILRRSLNSWKCLYF